MSQKLSELKSTLIASDFTVIPKYSGWGSRTTLATFLVSLVNVIYAGACHLTWRLLELFASKPAHKFRWYKSWHRSVAQCPLCVHTVHELTPKRWHAPRLCSRSLLFNLSQPVLASHMPPLSFHTPHLTRIWRTSPSSSRSRRCLVQSRHRTTLGLCLDLKQRWITMPELR